MQVSALPAIAAGLSALVTGSVTLAAQPAEDPNSRAVVQALPPAGVDDLNIALRQLARDPRDLGALIEAGNASLKLHDIGAAIGFFGRADELSPGNPRVKLGLAGAFVRSERPLEALRLFDEAEQAGTSTAMLAADRGLAYDLVGDPAAAQAQYVQAMAIRQDDELIRRLALSHAISGDRSSFEKVLFPLLVRRDLGAYRTRAFGLAILGDEKEAVSIAETVMPPDLAARMTPYLRYMKRLTKAQQAAAANLGIFPRAAQIGRDDPRIAAYVPTGRAATPIKAADTALAPQGEPLGPRPSTASKNSRRRPDRQPVVASASSPPSVREIPPVKAPQPVQTASAVGNQSSLAVIVERQQPSGPAPTVATPVVEQARQAVETAQPVADTSPGFNQIQSTAVAEQSQPVPSVADAFAEFRSQTAKGPDLAGAVDITAIKPPREKAEPPAPKPPETKTGTKSAAKPAAKPEPPKNPSRVWVQLATGRDRKALAFDWRRMSKKAPAVLGKVKPFAADWGRTSRLLAGPYDSQKAADKAVALLKKDGFDSFTFTSDDGQAVDPLP